MGNYKYVYNDLILFDYQNIEIKLTEMAEKGWELCEIGTYLLKFKKTKPVRKRYAVTFDKEASFYDPEPGETGQTIEEYCAQAGWEKLMDWNQMKIFHTTDMDAVPIETDEAVRLEAIKAAMKKTFLPTHWVVLILFLVLLGIMVKAHTDGLGPIDVTGMMAILSNWGKIFIGGFLVSAPVFVGMFLVIYKLWVLRSEKSVEEGGVCASTKPIRVLNIVETILVEVFTFAIIVSLMMQGDAVVALKLAFGLATFILFVFIVRKIASLMKKKGISKAANVLAVYVMAFILIMTRELTVEKLFPEDVIQENEKNTGTIFLYTDSRDYDEEGPYYEICQVRADFLYDYCLNRMIHRYENGIFLETTEDSWNVDKVYRFHVDESYYDSYHDPYDEEEDTAWIDEAIENSKHRVLLLKDDYIIMVNDKEVADPTTYSKTLIAEKERSWQ